jgi:hypothetical protein
VTTAARKRPAPDPEELDDELDGGGEETGMEPVLEIDTLARARPTVLIKTEKDREGELYEMRLPEEFGIEEDQKFRSELREFGQLMAKDALTAAEKKRLRARLDHMARKILEAPDEVHRALVDRQRQRIVTSFTSALFVEDASALPDLTARIGSITGS